MIFLRILAGVLGTLLILETVMSAIRTFVLPRGDATRLARLVFVGVRLLFNFRMRFQRTFADRDRTFALFAPVSLLLLPGAWLLLVGIGYTGIYWALGTDSWALASRDSGSSLFTLGNAPISGAWPTTMISFTEAGLGLALLALLIAYLPTMYASFQRREVAVTLLEVAASSPPSAGNMLERYHRIHGLDKLDELWPRWETWFADIEESHTSLGAMAFFRSPQPDRSWITAAGAVLDTASFVASSLEVDRAPGAEILVRAGYVALRGVADFFAIAYDPNPAPDDPISITREEYDQLWDRLAAIGVPLAADRDAAWRSFAGWRVNYDRPLLALAGLVMAPPAPWSSDRAIPFRRPPIRRKRRRVEQP